MNMIYNASGRTGRTQDSNFYAGMKSQQDSVMGGMTSRPSGSGAPRYTASRQQRAGIPANNQKGPNNSQTMLLSQANADSNTGGMLSQQGDPIWSSSRYGSSQHIGLTGLSQVSFDFID